MTKLIIAIIVAIGPLASAQAASGDIARGQQDFRACAQCHSLEPNRNMTGPSLAGLWGRKAGSLPSFERYSDALKSSGIIWDERSLDAWLTDPQKMVPDNDMPFQGIRDARVRADLLAFLKEASKPGAPPLLAQQGGMKGMGGMGGMMGGMMGGGRDVNLKNLDSSQHVKAIAYCRDTYRVTTADGKTRAFVIEEVLPIEDRHDGDIARAGGDDLRRRLQAAAADRGLLGPHGPVEYGGQGLSMTERARVFEAAG